MKSKIKDKSLNNDDYLDLKLEEKKYTWIIDLFLVLKYCAVPIFFLLIGSIFFWKIDQVIDVVRSLFEKGQKLKIFWLQAAALWWALNVWYTSRTFLDLSEINYTNKKNKKCSEKFQKFIPRVLGSFVFVIIIISYWIAKPDISYLYLLFMVNIFEAIFYWTWILNRRKISKKILQIDVMEIDNKAFEIKFGKAFFRDFFFIFLNYIIFITFFITFVISKVTIPRFFGIAGILVLALAIWTPVFIFTILFKKIKHIPVILLLIILTLIFSFINNNHEIRLINKKDISNYYSEKITNYKEWIKKEYNINQYFKIWLKEKEVKNNKISDYPIFLISVEGGGLRSAYWSSLLLTTLQEKIKESLNIDFNEHIFSISGVSGGSLGSSVYVGLIQEYLQEKKPDKFNFVEKSQKILGDDFLSPVGSALLFPEIIQRFLAFPINSFDRAIPLEKAWEKSWGKNINKEKNTLSSPFLDLWGFDNTSDICSVPSLFLNSTCVENGNRVIISNISLKDSFSNSIDLKDKEKGISYFNRIRFSTAILMSARFPYITPAGRLYTNPDDLFKNYKFKIWGHVVDGGYFENSGVTTTFDLFIQLKKTNPFIDKQNIYFIIIKNNEEKGKNKKNKKSISIYETKQPLQTLFNTWASRSSYSIDLINNSLDSRNILQINMSLSGDEVPLGWYLSEEAKNKVKNYVEGLFKIDDENGENTKKILEVLKKYYR